MKLINWFTKQNKIIWVILFLGVAIKLFSITHNVWRDEAFTALAVKENFSDLLNIIANEPHPPLYLVFMFFWTKIFGLSEISLRMPSVIAFVFTFLISIKLSEFIKTERIRFLFLMLVAFNPLITEISRDARQYSFLLTLATLLVYLTTLISQYGITNKRVTGFVITAILIAATHYIGLVLVGVCLLTIIIKLKKSSGVLVIISTISIIPFLVLAATQYNNIEFQGSWLKFNPPGDIYYTIAFLFTGEGFSVDRLLGSLEIFMLMVLMLMLLRYSVRKQFEHKGILFITGFSFLAITLVSFVIPLLYIRYVAFLAIPALFLVSLGTQNLNDAFFNVIFITLATGFFAIGLFRTPAYRDIYDLTKLELSEQQIIHASPESYLVFKYYMDEPGKIFGEKNDFVYFQGTAVLDESDFTRELPAEKSFKLLEHRLFGSQESGIIRRSELELLGYEMQDRKNLEDNFLVETWIKFE